MLGILTKLTYLSLGTNELTSNIPRGLGLLAELTQLILERNQLSGTIPNELSLLTKLTWLDLSQNQLTGTVPTSLASLPLDSKSTQSLLFLFRFATIVSHVRTFFHTVFTFDSNDLTGSLDAFCNNSNYIEVFAANACGQDEMNCTCCNHCCNPDGWCDPI
jgi:Leucine-rich repeat (LRR) protein